MPAGYFDMGDSHRDGLNADGETPVHRVFTDSYSIDATTVTNTAFTEFVSATGYRTEAEVFGFSAVFHLAVQAHPSDLIGTAAGTPWWVGVRGADWRHPHGRLSGLDNLEDHPVVHVSWNDALAYCAWADRALATEAQWERAARAGREHMRYPWGDELDAENGWRCNIWQGLFPTVNTLEDGALTTAPVRSYEPNAWGLWQMVGNVWEWCADRFDHDYYRISPEMNPKGPEQGSQRSIRGGSYLCHDSYCNRYRNAARSSNTPDSSMGNAGFRTVSP
ncbi:formylglycine-generating enzyme family protein [Pseudarthrobacter sp. AB1]|uniref:formylglycine-generating enzyme family protein n=1 Tax=Pseudarthrobacter sp. AB1 TaxID=2138309 RepID=UPI002814EC12|nr:formylglycine-generating enzyme family protein [Pseudarthrobacter sp. AB1]MBE4719324.1 sulfatase modifying factor 1 (C-alpha-formyglycine- generating enzyme 1) [Pseudarthrobacter sp. AB1]